MKLCGIYIIRNIINGKFYIGSSNNVFHRLSRHKCNLKFNRHTNLHLQNSCNIYGLESFEFELLFECHERQLQLIEQNFLDRFCNTEQCYNIAKTADCPNRGRKLGPMTESHRLKLSGPKSDEIKQKISESKRGKVSWRKFSQEIRQEAKQLRNNGKTYQEIADSIKCCHRTARLLVNDIYQGQ